MTFTVNPLNRCAAEIQGLDCSRLRADDVFAVVNKAFLQYPVVVFRDQALSAPQLAAFARLFGKLEGYGSPAPAGAAPPTAALRQTGARQTPDQMLYRSPDDPDILVMTNEIRPGDAPLAIIDNAETWHSDGSHKAEPYKAVLLQALRNPACGGATEFCDLRALYDLLPRDAQKTLGGLSGVHHWSKSKNPLYRADLDPEARNEGDRIAAMIPDMLQPLVCAHPETGRPHLYLSPRFTLRIDGVEEAQSQSLLAGLFGLMDDPRFIYRHEWRENDLLIWDNRCTNHRVQSYAADDIRTRYRVTVSGEPARRYGEAP